MFLLLCSYACKAKAFLTIIAVNKPLVQEAAIPTSCRGQLSDDVPVDEKVKEN